MAWGTYWKTVVSTDSIALRLSGLFTLVATVIFLLIGWTLYLTFQQMLHLCFRAS